MIQMATDDNLAEIKRLYYRHLQLYGVGRSVTTKDNKDTKVKSCRLPVAAGKTM